MARPRTPTNILKLKGAHKVNPGRLKERDNEPENKRPIGEPSEYLTELEKQFFAEIVKDSIDGVLGGADRLAVEQAAKLLVKCRGLADEPATAAEQNQFFKYLSQFGMTPADRSKISIQGQKKQNSFDD